MALAMLYSQRDNGRRPSNRRTKENCHRPTTDDNVSFQIPNSYPSGLRKKKKAIQGQVDEMENREGEQ